MEATVEATDINIEDADASEIDNNKNKSNSTIELIAKYVMSQIDNECNVDIENSIYEEYIRQIIRSSDMIDKLYLLCYTT